MKDLKTALNEALLFEERGFDIYSTTAKETDNPIVKKTFEYLAEQEKIHVENIKNYLRSNHPDEEIKKGDGLEEIKRFFHTTTEKFKEKTVLSDTDIKAHETALELEKKSYDYYKKEMQHAVDPETKAFFKFLMEQESYHYELIEKALQFTKDPLNFYAADEAWIFDGG